MASIVGWEGFCFMPGNGKKDELGRELVMTQRFAETRTLPEEAWADATKLAIEASTEFRGIRPVLKEDNAGERKLVTYAIFTTTAEKS